MARLAEWEVWVDDRKLGTIANGEELQFTVGSMSQSIKVKPQIWLGGKGSNVIDHLQADQNNSVELVCGHTRLSLWLSNLILVPGLVPLAIRLGMVCGVDFGEAIDYFLCAAACLLFLGIVIASTVAAYRPGGLVYLKHKNSTVA